MGKHERLTGAEQTAQRRVTLRAQGLRPRTIWLPDLRDPKVREEIAESCRAIAASPGYEADLAFIEALQDWPEDEAD